MRWLLLALSCCSGPPELDSPDPTERFAAVILLDRAQMREDLEVLLEMARHDPDERVRREVIRELGWSRDPRVLPLLDELLAQGQHVDEVIQSLASYGPEGCTRLRQHAWRRARCLSAR